MAGMGFQLGASREGHSALVHRIGPVRRLLVHGILLTLCLPFVLPLAWMVSTSLKSDRQVYGAPGESMAVTLSDLMPNPLEWSNYADAVRTVPLGAYLQNTLMLCAANVICAVLSSAVVAYGFARLSFPGRNVLFMLMIGTLALPSQVTMVPVFTLFRSLGWYGTYLPLVVPSLFGSAFFVFLLRQFFQTIPDELSEAARIDGAGEWRVFWQILLPLAKPAMATCALFQFLGTWNDYSGPLLYINDPSMYTLAYGLEQFLSSYGGEWTQLMAAATIFTLPIVILFFLTQRTFIQGIATTGGKS